MKLIFFGGVQGVGKTTLLSWLEKQFKESITLLDPGELFRQYFYKERIKTVEEIEEMIVNEIEKSPEDSVIVIHWHYAVKRPLGFIPQICYSRLKRIARNKKVERVVLLSVDASIEAIRQRRLKDRRSKNRDLSEVGISREVEKDKEFLAEHEKLFSRMLGGKKVATFQLINEDLQTAQATLSRFFRGLLA